MYIIGTMEEILLLIWFWLYAGCWFCNTVTDSGLFLNNAWWKKIVFWPYYLCVYYLRYLIIKKNEKKNKI